MSGIDPVRAAALDSVPHGFLGRRGGVSTGVYASLNTGPGSSDAPALVAENRRRAAEAILPGAALASCYQIHSAECVTVDAGIPDDARPRADALVTARRGVLLGILTADCGPVLFADREARVIGAAHAGWKGAIGGVTDATLAAMETLGASRERIAAAVGPCIAQPSYEVDSAFRERFADEDTGNARFFAAGRDATHWQFDLPGYIAHRLRRAGVGTVEVTGVDTYAEEARFFSYRRSTHRGEADGGRQISLIGLE